MIEYLTKQTPDRQSNPRIGVSLAVWKGEEILLGLRPKNEFDEYECWGLPGGRLEFGENPFECALRECREETGITPDDATFINHDILPVYDSGKFNGGHWVTLFFEIGVKEETFANQCEPDKCETWLWLTLDETRNIKLFPPTLTFIKYALRQSYLRKHA